MSQLGAASLSQTGWQAGRLQTFIEKQLLKKVKVPQTTTFLGFHPMSGSFLALTKPEGPSSKKVEVLSYLFKLQKEELLEIALPTRLKRSLAISSQLGPQS